MTNSDSRSVSEAGSLAKPARRLEDKTSFSVHTILGNGNRDGFQSRRLVWMCFYSSVWCSLHTFLGTHLYVHTQCG